MKDIPAILGDAMFTDIKVGVKTIDFSTAVNGVEDPVPFIKRMMISHVESCPERAIFVFKGMRDVK